MKKAIFIDGGAGRVIAAIPALIKYVRKNPDHDLKIFIGGWDSLLWGIPELHDISYSMDVKGIFNSMLKDVDVVLSPEPYRQPNYFNQKISLAEGFDEIINETTDHSDLEPPTMVLNKMEEKNAASIIAQAKSQQQKQKTIVIQPFGRSAQRVDENDIIDESSRSIEQHVYLKLVKKLSTKYNIIFFGEKNFWVPGDDYTFKPEADLRVWSAIVEAADYFIGCDSLGQHIARAFNKPGTVVIGSTFAVNTSYPDYFNIVEKKDIKKVYAPIRISGFDGHLADRMNDRCMDFSDAEIEDVYKGILNHIETKSVK
jgi:hypothetical protein